VFASPKGGFARQWVKPMRFRYTRQTNLIGFFVLVDVQMLLVGEHQQRRSFLSASRMIRMEGFRGFLGYLIFSVLYWIIVVFSKTKRCAAQRFCHFIFDFDFSLLLILF